MVLLILLLLLLPLLAKHLSTLPQNNRSVTSIILKAGQLRGADVRSLEGRGGGEYSGEGDNSPKSTPGISQSARSPSLRSGM